MPPGLEMDGDSDSESDGDVVAEDHLNENNLAVGSRKHQEFSIHMKPVKLFSGLMKRGKHVNSKNTIKQ